MKMNVSIMTVMVMCLAGSAVGQVANQWQYAIGPSSMTFAGYEQFEQYMSDPSVRSDLINAYNNLGGLPSLASPALGDCLVNELWLTSSTSSQVWSCRCPYDYQPNELVLLAPPPSRSPLCYGQLTPAIVGDKFAGGNGSLALFRSSIPFGCDPQCLLHGICQQNGQCVCPTPPSNASTAPVWKGQQCQVLIPPPGSAAYFTTLTWSPIAASEELYFSLAASTPCTMYITRMPAESAYGSYVQVQNFFMDTQQLYFDYIGSSPPSQIVVQITIVAPTDVSICCTGNTGGSQTNTIATLSVSNNLPVQLGGGVCFYLPNN